MLKLTTLSDAQSELMQGGCRRIVKYKPCKPSRPGTNGHTSTTTNNIHVGAAQKSDNLALTLGGKNSLAYNDVFQSMNVTITV
jgi:hypothetical protein